MEMISFRALIHSEFNPRFLLQFLRSPDRFFIIAPDGFDSARSARVFGLSVKSGVHTVNYCSIISEAVCVLILLFEAE